MEKNQESLKTFREKRMWKWGIFSVKLSSFILMSLLTLNFGAVPVSAEKGGKFGMNFLKTEVDSELVHFEPEVYEDYETETENKNKGSAENFDPIAQPSIKDVITLLKNVQTELSALKNQTTAENQELKRQIEQKIGTNHDEIKKEFSDLSKDLKSQMTSLANQIQQQQNEKSKSSQTPNQTASGQDKTKETGHKIHLDAPASAPPPTPSGYCAPQFYSIENFKGSLYNPPSDAWRTKCVNLEGLDRFTSSLKTGGHCLLLCPERDCKPKSLGAFSIPCRQILGSTKEVSKLEDSPGYGTRIESFRRC